MFFDFSRVWCNPVARGVWDAEAQFKSDTLDIADMAQVEEAVDSKSTEL